MDKKNQIQINTEPKEMGKGTKILYLVIFAVLILVPVAAFLLVQDYVDTTNYEQRTLAAFPYSEESASDGEPTTYATAASEFESWFEDHLPFRNQLLTLYGLFEYEVLKTSTSDSVIVGKDGWLFYKGSQVAGEDPVGDYMGTNLLTNEELETIAANFTAARDELAAMGCEFYVYFAPNKERVYSEYMPDMYGEVSEVSALSQVVEYLTENTDLNVICAYDDLMEFKEENPDTPVYFKYDTHWNMLGAYVAAGELVEAMGFGFVDLSEVTITTVDYEDYDLARLLHLQKILTDDEYYVLTGYTPHEMLMETEDDITFHYDTQDYTAPGQKLLVIGDSFSTLLAPYVACHFLKATSTFYYSYTYDMLLEEAPTVVVYEAVERYIGNMVDFTLEDGYTGSTVEGE